MTVLRFGPNTVQFQRYDESNTVAVPIARLFLIGRTERGPVGVPTTVTDLEDYIAKFGAGTQANGTDRLAQELDAYRQRVGDLSDAVVLRGFHGDPTGATAKDGSTGKIAVDAASAGGWGNGLRRAAVVSADNATITLTVREIVNGVVRRERTLTVPVSADGVLALNGAFAGMITARWNALGSTVISDSTAPGAALNFVALTGGTDSASLTIEDLSGNINPETQERSGLFTLRGTEWGGGAIIAEGVATPEMRTLMYQFAADYERVYIDGPQADLLPTAAETEKATLELLAGADHATYTYPRARVSQTPGALTRSALGYVAGEVVAGIMQSPGTVRPPAGRTLIPDVQRSPNGRDLLVHTDNAQRLKSKGINVLILRGGQVELEGLSLMRADLLQPATNQIHERMIKMALTYDVGPRLAKHNYVYVDSKGAFFNVVKGTIREALRPYWASGALYGRTLDEAFDIKMDFELNPTATLEKTGRAAIRLKYKTSPVSEGLDLAIFHVPITAAF